MTEAEWVGGVAPTPLLEFIYSSSSQRKLRLFAVAVARRVAHLFIDPRSGQALELAEQYADRAKKGPPTVAELQQAEVAAWRVGHALNGFPGDQYNAARAATETATRSAFRAAQEASAHASHARGRQRAEELLSQAELLRCIFGNPFRSRPLLVGEDSLVVGLAQAGYDNRTLSQGHLEAERLAVLSDAPEDAGCEDAELLTHLRSPGPHVRGCWALDLVLCRK